MTNEEALAVLRRDAEAAQQRYMQTLGEIRAKKAQLAEAMTTLNEMGCATVADADARAEHLQTEIDGKLTEIRRLLG